MRSSATPKVRLQPRICAIYQSRPVASLPNCANSEIPWHSKQTADFEFECNCAENFEKSPLNGHCIAINPCSDLTSFPQPCGAHAVCSYSEASPGQRTCVCPDGYARINATSCSPIDVCASSGDANPCFASTSTCQSTGPGQHSCVCKKGYENPSLSGCQPIKPCQRTPGLCGSGAACQDTDPGLYVCNCLAGYETLTLSGCTAIDNCKANATLCGVHGLCNSTGPGTHQCYCREGYELLPTAAECSPVNACATAPSPCWLSSNTLCNITGPGTHTCACTEGHRREQPGDQSCAVIDRCLDDPDWCGTGTTCTFAGPGRATCACAAGYETLTAKGCVPIDPCSKTPGLCGTNAVCAFEGPGRHSCSCKTDYEGWPECQPVDVCEKRADACGDNSVCTFNGPGKHSCACAAGYYNANPAGSSSCQLDNPCAATAPAHCSNGEVCEQTGAGTARCQAVASTPGAAGGGATDVVSGPVGGGSRNTLYIAVGAGVGGIALLLVVGALVGRAKRRKPRSHSLTSLEPRRMSMVPGLAPDNTVQEKGLEATSTPGTMIAWSGEMYAVGSSSMASPGVGWDTSDYAVHSPVRSQPHQDPPLSPDKAHLASLPNDLYAVVGASDASPANLYEQPVVVGADYEYHYGMGAAAGPLAAGYVVPGESGESGGTGAARPGLYEEVGGGQVYETAA